MSADTISNPMHTAIATPIPSQRVPYCWMASILAHAAFVGAALVLMSELELTLPPPTFRWDVVVVDTPAPQETPAETPPPSSPVQQPVEVTKPPVPVKSVAKPVVEVDNRPIEQPTAQPAAQQMTQPPTKVVQESLISTQQVTQAPTEIAQTSPISSKPVTQTEIPPVETLVQTMNTEAMSEPVQQAVVSTAVTSLHESTVTTANPTEQQAVTSEVQTMERVVRQENPTFIPAVQHRQVRHMQVRSMPQARPDYGWLAQTLFERVERHKDYPRQARLNHWEGRVIVYLTIEQRGNSVYLVKAGIAETSGHAVLDQYTLEMLQKVFPLGVKHSLGQREVLLHLPFSYRLD